VQVDPIKPELKAPITQRLKLQCDGLLSRFCCQIQSAPLHRGAQRRHPPHGKAVHVDPSKPALKASGTKPSRLKCDKLLSNYAFKFNSRRYSTGAEKVEVIKQQAAGRLDIYKLQWEQKRDQMREEDLHQKIQAGGGLGQPDLISRSGQPAPSILGDFRRVGSDFGSFSSHDAVHFGFRIAREFRVYARVHFANTIQTDLLIQLTRPLTAIRPKMLTGSQV